MNDSDYLGELDEVPVLTKSQSDGVAGYLARCVTNARFRLFRESSLGPLRLTRPVVLLGHLIQPSSALRDNVTEEILKLPWCTYRSHFRPITRLEAGKVGKVYTSDQGWGCTLRVGQMVLLAALSKHLGIPYSENRFMYAAMICENLENSGFSLHNLVEIGRKYLRRTPGDWCSAGTVSHILHYIIRETEFFPDFTVSVAMDGAIFRDEVLAEIAKRPVDSLKCDCDPGTTFCPSCAKQLWKGSLLLLVPLMPGRECIDPAFHEAIRFFLYQPQSLGMMGGMGKSAVYVVGYQDDLLMYLDPHYVQRSARDEEDLLMHLDTYQAHSIGLLKLEEASSSLALAFWLDSFDSFLSLLTSISTHRSTHNGLVFVRERSLERSLEDAIEIAD